MNKKPRTPDLKPLENLTQFYALYSIYRIFKEGNREHDGSSCITNISVKFHFRSKHLIPVFGEHASFYDERPLVQKALDLLEDAGYITSERTLENDPQTLLVHKELAAIAAILSPPDPSAKVVKMKSRPGLTEYLLTDKGEAALKEICTRYKFDPDKPPGTKPPRKRPDGWEIIR